MACVRLYACMLLISLAFPICLSFVCPPDWLSWKDNCYYISSPSSPFKIWSQAHVICTQMQGDLLYIESQDELDWIKDRLNEMTLLKGQNLEWWTGLNDQNEFNRWVWSANNQTMTKDAMIPWHDSPPAQNSEQDCQHHTCSHCAKVTAEIDYVNENLKKPQFSGLVVQPCAVKNQYICKRTNISTIPSKCDYADRWLHIEDACWKLFHHKEITWSEARDYCEMTESGRLAAIHNKAEQNALLTVSTANFHEFWIGLQVNKSGSFVSGAWTDGSDLTHQDQPTYWATGQPNFKRITQGCVYMDNMPYSGEGWNLGSCYDHKSFVCQRPYGVCRAGWDIYNSRCYQANIQNKKSWQGAFDFCKAQNSTLLEITADSKFILHSHFMYYIGIDSMWLGFLSKDGVSKWSTSNTQVNMSVKLLPDTNNETNPLCGLLTADGNGTLMLTDNCAIQRTFVCTADASDSVIDYKHPPVDTICEPEYIQYRGSCYKIYSQKETWSQAEMTCKQDSSSLLSIGSSQEQAYINAHTSMVYWIGLSAFGQTHKWLWKDGSNTDSFTNFRSGYTRNIMPNAENCVTLQGRYSQFKGQWMPAKCDTKLPFVCEKQGLKITPFPDQKPGVDPECGRGWVPSLDYTNAYGLPYCYQVNSENKVWNEADRSCKGQGGHLASVTSPHEQLYISNIIPKSLPGVSVWLGGTDKSPESAWIWTDGQPFSYINWDGLRSHGQGKATSCIGLMLDSKYWRSEKCDIKRPYICKKLKKSAMTTAPVTTPMTTIATNMAWSCTAGYTLYGSGCYKFYKMAITQRSATKICQKDHGFLASAANAQEAVNEVQYGLQQTGLTSATQWWLGLEDKDGDGEFKWQDGSTVTYVDWAEYEPSPISVTDRCVVVKTPRAKWTVKSCEDDDIDGFICKKSPVLAAATTPKDAMKYFCPSATTHMRNPACYLVIQKKLGWETARDACEKNAMQLLWFDDVEEHNYISSLFKEQGVSKFWVNYRNYYGVYKIGDAYVLPSQYMGIWNKDHTGNENNMCTYVETGTYKWYDEDCGTFLPYVCKSYMMGYEPKSPPSKITCPKDWHAAGSNCYQTSQNYRRQQKKTWYEARDYCRALGGDLASIHAVTSDADSLKSIFTNQFGQVMSSEYWLGLNRLDITKSHVWSDGSNFDYSKWRSGEPDFINKVELCAVANVESQSGTVTMTYGDRYCSTAYDFVCQLPNGKTPATIPPSTTVSTPSLITGVQGQCDPGWVEFEQSCYKVKRDWLSWIDADRDCRTKESAHLVTIHSKIESDFVVTLITKESNERWAIGLSKIGKGNFEWVDGTSLDFVLWHEYEPSDTGRAEMCVQLYHNSGFWNDYNCALKNSGHICERSLNGMTTTAVSTTPSIGNCRPGFTELDNECYGLFGVDKPLSWKSAQMECRSNGNGFDMVSIPNERVQNLVTILTFSLNSSAWIGFISPRISKFIWSNNHHTEYTNWLENEPGYLGYKRDYCVRLVLDNPKHLGQWKSVSCSEIHPYLCMGPKDYTGVPNTTPTSKLCGGKGYEEYGGQCYRVYGPAHYGHASQACLKDGVDAGLTGSIASIADVKEQAFMQYLLLKNKVDNAWIGMKRQEYVFNEITVGEYVWQDNFTVTYSNWANNQPRAVEKKPNCVQMAAKTGKWYSADCSEEILEPFICKLTSETPGTRPATRLLCEDPTAIPHEGMCYKVYTPQTGVPWHLAFSECIQEGMNLVSIHSPVTQDFLTEVISLSGKPSDIWIGLYHSRKDGWLWMDGTEVKYVQWAEDQPKIPDSTTQSCVYMKYVDNSYLIGANWTAGNCYSNKGWICATPGYQLTTSTLKPTTTAQRYCYGDSEWHLYKGNCYYIGRERISWLDGRDRCKAMSAELASFHGKDEIDAVFNDMPSMHTYIASIGLTRIGYSSWQWTDRSLVDYDNWYKGEPNNDDGSEGCTFMYTYTSKDIQEQGAWNDGHCNSLANYVCMKPEHPSLTTKPTQPVKLGHCPEDWAEYGNKCYSLFVDNLNWTEARDSCRQKGYNSDLISIPNAKVQAFLTSQLYVLERNVWIGLSDRYWNNEFWWSNNKRVTYTNWMINEPNDYSEKNCVEMAAHRITPGKWKDTLCSYRQPYLCEMDKDPDVTTTTSSYNFGCPAGYKRFDGFNACYKLHNKQVSQHDALETCKKENSTLASVTSVFEQAFIESLLFTADKPVWIGMLEVSIPLEGPTSQFLWMDRWPVTYTNWARNRPATLESSTPRCVVINPETGRWNDTACYFSHSFICKKSFDQPTTTPIAEYKCNGTEIRYGAKCFTYGGDVKRPFGEAHLDCLKRGLEIASFHSLDEFFSVMDELHNRKRDENFWIGLFSSITGGFRWMDKSPVDWTYWSRGEPNDAITREEESCTEIQWENNGRWNDVTCSKWLNYLCERPADLMLFSSSQSPQSSSPSSPLGGTTTNSTSVIAASPSNSKASEDAGVVAAVVIVSLIFVAALAVGAIVLYRKSRFMKSTNFTEWASASFKNGGESVSIDGSINFTNKLYDQTDPEVESAGNTAPVIAAS